MYAEESSSTYKRTLEDITVIFKLFLHGLKLPLDSKSQAVSVSDRQTDSWHLTGNAVLTSIAFQLPINSRHFKLEFLKSPLLF